MWLYFLKAFDFNPPERHGRTTIAYRAGEVAFVRKVCARQALELGIATPAPRPIGRGPVERRRIWDRFGRRSSS